MRASQGKSQFLAHKMLVIFARLGCLDLTGLITVYLMTPALSRDGHGQSGARHAWSIRTLSCDLLELFLGRNVDRNFYLVLLLKSSTQTISAVLYHTFFWQLHFHWITTDDTRHLVAKNMLVGRQGNNTRRVGLSCTGRKCTIKDRRGMID